MNNPDRTTAAEPAPPGSLLGPVLVIAAIAFLYLSYLSTFYNFDGVVFSFWLGKAVMSHEIGELFHPHHLLYLPLALVFHQAFGLIGIDLGMIKTLQVFDLILGLTALTLFQALCFRLTRDRFVSTLTTALLGLSFSFWFLSIEPEVYLLFTCLMLTGIILALRFTRRGASPAWPWRAAALGVMGVLVMGGHIIGGLFLIPLGLAALLYLRREEGDSWGARLRRGLAPAALLSVTALLVMALLYGLAYHLHSLPDSKDFITWVLDLVLPDPASGTAGGHVEVTGSSLLAGFHGFSNNLLAAGRYQPLKPSWGPLLRGVAIMVYLFVIGVYLVKLPGLIRQSGRVQMLILASFLPLAAFSMLWEPTNFEIKTELHPLIWLGVAMAFARIRKGSSRPWVRFGAPSLLVLLALMMFAYNFTLSARPLADEANNRDLQKAYFVRDHTPPGSVVYIAGASPGYMSGKIYLIYFAGRQPRILHWILGEPKEPYPQKVLAYLYEDRTKPVYALSEVIEPGPVSRALAQDHGLPSEAVPDLFREFHPLLTARYDKNFALYRLDLQSGSFITGP